MKITKTAAIALAILALAGCTKSSDGTGTIRLAMEEPQGIIEVTKSSVSDYTTLPSKEAFTITIKDAQGATVWNGLLADYDTAKEYAVGNYSVSAVYGAEGEEGFDKPYFTGTQTFAVQAAQTTNVTIPVSLANSIVKVECTDSFKNWFSSYSFTLTTGTGTVIEFPASEKRAAFIDAFKFSVAGTMTTTDGKAKSFSKSYDSGIEPATCYTLKFDVSNIGGLSITITFNDSTETVDLGEVELNS